MKYDLIHCAIFVSIKLFVMMCDAQFEGRKSVVNALVVSAAHRRLFSLCSENDLRRQSVTEHEPMSSPINNPA